MDRRDPKLREVWEQEVVPVIYRPGGARLMVRLPYAPDNKLWLRGDHRIRPKWDPNLKCWHVPKAWFEELVMRTLPRYGGTYVIQPFHATQKCAPACWDADGVECECSCMGANHGSGKPDGRWHEVSETCAVSWGPRQYSCRLLRPAPRPRSLSQVFTMPR